MTEGVFVSYRRDDAPGHAGRLYDRLVTRFGVGRVFMDVDSIEPGEDFVEAIESTLAGASVVVVVIGPTWVTARDEDGVVRLTKPDDFVHLEVSRALQLGKRVIPVLVDDALVPEPRELPEDLRALARRNAIEISDGRFHSDVDRLADAIEEMMAPPTTPMPVVPVTEPVSAAVTAPTSEPVTPPPTAPEPLVEPPPDRPPPSAPPEPLLGGRLRRIGWPVVAAVVVAVVMVIGALAWALSSGDDGGTAADTTAADNAVATSATETTAEAAGSTVPAATGAVTTGPTATTIGPTAPAAPSVVSTISIQGRPVDVLVAGGTLWAAVEGGLERFAPPGPDAPAVGRVELGSPGFGNDLIVWDGVLYVTRFDTNALAVVDLVTGALRGDPIPLPGRPLTGTVVGDTLWLAIHGGNAGTAGAIVAIRDRAVVDEIALDERPYQIEAVGDRLWVTFAESDGVAMIDLGTRQVTRFAVGPEPVDVRLIGGQLWVTVSGDDQIALVDPATGAVTATIPVGDRPWKVVDAFGAVWVSNYGDGQSASSVMRIDPASNAVGEPIPVGVWPDEMAVGTDALFVGNFGSRSISVIDPGT